MAQAPNLKDFPLTNTWHVYRALQNALWFHAAREDVEGARRAVRLAAASLGFTAKDRDDQQRDQAAQGVHELVPEDGLRIEITLRRAGNAAGDGLKATAVVHD